MVYRICNIKDIDGLPPMDEQAKDLISYYAKALSLHYGEDRDIESDGGYILYAPTDATNEEIKTYFDYTCHTPECVDLYGQICSYMFLLNNDYVVTILTRVERTPVEILKELDYKGD